MALKNGRQNANLQNILIGSVIPTGTIAPFGGGNVPTGWLLCHGQAISRTTYSELFLSLGTTYGVGDGATTFNLPDYRGRVPAGRDNMGGTSANRLTSGGSGVNGAVLGATGGAQLHTLSTAELASHNHSQNAHTHAQDAHAHQIFGQQQGSNVGGADAVRFGDQVLRNTGGTVATNQNTTATNNPTGSGSAHQNTQPTIIANYIIKV